MIDLLAAAESLTAWEYAWRFPQVFCATLLFGIVCPIAGSYLLLRRMTLLALALPQCCMAGIACGIFLAPLLPHGFPGLAHGPAPHEEEAPPEGFADLAAELEQLGLEGPGESAPPPPAHTAHEHAEGTGHEFFHADPSYELGWTFLAAGLGLLLFFWLGRRGGTMPAEARLGGLFVAASAATLLLVAESGFGREHVEHILRGDLVEIARSDFPVFVGVFFVVGALLVLYRRPLLAISYDPESAKVLGLRTGRWELLFLVLVGALIAVGVLIAGPIVLFGLLVLPTLAARRFARSFGAQLTLASAFGALSTMLGFAASIPLEWVLGPTIVLAALLLTVLSALVAPR